MWTQVVLWAKFFEELGWRTVFFWLLHLFVPLLKFKSKAHTEQLHLTRDILNSLALPEVVERSTRAPGLSHIRNTSLANIIANIISHQLRPVRRGCFVHLTIPHLNRSGFNCDHGSPVVVHCSVALRAGLCAGAESHWDGSWKDVMAYGGLEMNPG